MIHPSLMVHNVTSIRQFRKVFTSPNGKFEVLEITINRGEADPIVVECFLDEPGLGVHQIADQVFYEVEK